MSVWPGKFVIGLTGNIATGKSVVRKMLEHLGAYGIDADALGHRAIAKDAPGYKPVVLTFGRWILGDDEQIDRAKLGRVVFADPQALKQLEEIVHPLVRQAADILIRRAKEPVIILEAIKLIESPLRQNCNKIWTTYSSPEIQLARLMQKRGMPEDAARQRITAQPPQADKVALANVVIRNDGTFEETWAQVSAAWRQQFPSATDTGPVKTQVAVKDPAGASGQTGVFTVEKARPRQAAEIATFINRASGGTRKLQSEDIMAAFGEKAYLLLRLNNNPVGIVGCQVENLVARADDLYIQNNIPADQALRALIERLEETSKDLQCEALLLFLQPQMARQIQAWQNLGYEQRTVSSLGVRAWQEAAQETHNPGEALFFKQLRKDRVLRPV